MARGINSRPIEATSTPTAPEDGVTVLVPVLDEELRLGPALDGLFAQGPELHRIIVIDGGSTDGTLDVARAHAARDARITIIDASPVPHDWNGKAWNLQRGLRELTDADHWVLTIDADVRPRPGLVAALVARARVDRLDVLSGATRQRLSGAAEGMIHPALLASLVYRYGIPGGVTTDPSEVQANGQCQLFRRSALDAIDGFADGQHSVCEDVTVSRRIAMNGGRVGFMETGALVDVEMYGSAREAWDNWPRSLTMRDRYAGGSTAVRLAEVLLVQALPLVVSTGALIARRNGFTNSSLTGSNDEGSELTRGVALLVQLNRDLTVFRLGMLAGMARAYVRAPWTYWLSPLMDLPVAVRLISAALRRHHTWRGRSITRG
jgi:dolichol-phosphate mannosyltransferase